MAPGLPTATLVEVELTTGVWTDVTSYVVGGSIEITHRNADAGTLDLDLDNADGRFNPENVASSYWPNFTEGKRARVLVRTSTSGNILSAAAASFEDATTGGWAGNPVGYTACTVANTVTFAQFGTRALLITWPTASAFGSAAQVTATGLVIGRAYTFSAYVRVPASNPAVRIGELFGVVTMSAPTGFSRTSTTTGAFERIAVTFTATSDTLRLGIVNSGASTAGQTVVVDGAMLEEGSTVGTFTTTAPTYYGAFHGHITEITPDYPGEPTQSKVHVLAVDLPGSLDRITLDTALKSHVQTGILSSADFYFPCDDDGARRRASDLTGNCQPMTLSGGGEAKFATLSGLDGDGSQFLELSGGKRLEHKRPAFTWDWPSGNAKLCGFFYTDGTDVDGEIFALCRQPRSVALTYISVYQAAQQLAWIAYENGTILGGGPATAYPLAAGWHAISLEAAGGGTTIQIKVDDFLLDTYTPSHSLPYRYLSVGGEPNTVGVANLISHVSATSLYMSQIVAGGVIAGTPNTMSQTDTLIESATNLAVALSGQITISGSTGPSDSATALACAGRTGLEVLRSLADSVGGVAYHDYTTDATQSIVIPGRDVTRSRTVAITVDAEADLFGGPTLERSLADKLGSVTAKTPEASIRVTGDGAGSLDLDVLLDDDGQLRATAEDRIARGDRLRTRLTSVTVDLANAANDLYASFYAADIGSRLRLSGLPTTYFSESYVDGYIDGWTYRPGVTGHPVTFDLAPADAPAEAIFDTSRWAFGDGVCTVTGGTAVGTTATGTMTLTWASGDTLTTTAGDYPMDFDWNGERVTVTSAPAGGTSPRTLTITARGVAPTIARVHVAGESIEPWEAARWSL